MKGITLFSLLNIALKNIFALILAAVVFAGAAYAYCEFVAVPRYSATGSLLVTSNTLESGDMIEEEVKSSGILNSDIVASINFMSTATDMLKQNGVYKLLAEKMDNKFSYNQLMGMSNVVRREDNSLYIDVTFTTSSPELSVTLVNNFMSVTPNYFAKQINFIKVSYFEVESASKIYPQTIAAAGMSGILGAGLVYAIFLILFLINTTIVNEKDFKERFDVPVIGTIPDFASAKSKKNSKYAKKNSKYGYYNRYYGRSR